MKTVIALLLAAVGTVSLAAPTAVARLAPDGSNVEFLFSNPGTQAYRCAIAEANVRLTGVPGLRPAQVFNVVLPAGAKDLIVSQPKDQVDVWRALHGGTVTFAEVESAVTLPRAGCELERTSAYVLALDDRALCEDPRRIARLYAVDPKLRTLTPASAPLAIDKAFERILSPATGRPVVYGLSDGAPRRIAAWTAGETLNASPDLFLPAAPRGVIRAGGQESLLPVIAMALLDTSSLVIAYQPAMLVQGQLLMARAFLDVVELDAGGIPAKVTRKTVDYPYVEASELLIARSQHLKDAATLFFTKPSVLRTIFAPQTISAGPPIDTFDPPRRNVSAPPYARINAVKKAATWEFAAPDVTIGTGFGERQVFLSSGTRIEAAPSSEVRIDDVLVKRIGALKAQGLQAWSLAADVAPVLSQSVPPSFCDVRLLSVDARDASNAAVALNTPDSAGRTRLHYLVEQGNLADVSSWLSRKPLVNVRDSGKYTPLMTAIKSNRGYLVAPLLAAGADFRLPIPDAQGTLRDSVDMLFEYGCDTCITPFLAASIALDKMTLQDGKREDSKKKFCAMRAQDEAILSRVPQPVPDEMKQMFAAPLQRRNIETALKFDCSKP